MVRSYLSRLKVPRRNVDLLPVPDGSEQVEQRPSSHRPVPFIVGAPRSGTTLLRMMLDSHPNMAVPPETYFLIDVIKRCQGERKSTSARKCLVETVTSHERWPEFHLDAGQFRQRIAEIDPFNLSDGVRTFYALYAERFGKDHWGDKTPGYLEHMQVISAILPEVHFIHLIRDGRDVALSIDDLWFGPNSIRDAASWWVNQIEQGREQGRNIPNYMEIRYEDLVLEPEATLRRVCAGLQLPWDDAMLDYHVRAADRLQELTARKPRGRGGAAISVEQRLQIHESATKPPRPERVSVWKREMQPADRTWFESVAGDLLHDLGYEVAGRSS